MNTLVWCCHKCGSITPRHPNTVSLMCKSCMRQMKRRDTTDPDWGKEQELVYRILSYKSGNSLTNLYGSERGLELLYKDAAEKLIDLSSIMDKRYHPPLDENGNCPDCDAGLENEI